MLILVRHAMPVSRADGQASMWPLSEEGHAAALRLRGCLPPGACLVASSELKARQTLAGEGGVICDHRFDEVNRVEPWENNYRELRRAYVDGVDHVNWEPRSAVVQRFNAGIAEHLTLAAPHPLVVATHGMAMTVWLAARVGLPNPAAFWEELHFPDAHIVDLSGRSVDRAFDL